MIDTDYDSDDTTTEYIRDFPDEAPELHTWDPTYIDRISPHIYEQTSLTTYFQPSTYRDI